MLPKSKTYLVVIIILATFLSLWRIGQHDLQEWDESRNGVNAYEMLHNGDFINYYYNGNLDTWNAKPPLMIWLIALSYKILGFNEFALRLPSALSSIIFFVLCFKLVDLMNGGSQAFVTCLILLSSKAILGNHIGSTADFDSLLILFLTASAFYFLLYYEKQKKYAIYLVGLFTALAFYTKGPASFAFMPGFFLYLLFRHNNLHFLKDKRFWAACLLTVSIISSWIILVYSFGKSAEQSFYGSKNSIETMLINDTFKRLTSSNFGEVHDDTKLFFFRVIDARLNIWNYLFYTGLLIGLFNLYKNRRQILGYMKDDSQKLALFSICLILPLSILLSFAINQNNWYLAPIFMFIAVIIMLTIDYLSGKWKWLFFVFTLLFIFTFVRHAMYLYSQSQSIHYALSENKNLRGGVILVADGPPQNILLYFEWLNASVINIKNVEEGLQFKGKNILLKRNQISPSLLNSVVPQEYFDEYCLAKIK